MTSLQMSELRKLSVNDKIMVVQTLWDDIAEEQSFEELPEAHKKIPDERIQKIAKVRPFLNLGQKSRRNLMFDGVIKR